MNRARTCLSGFSLCMLAAAVVSGAVRTAEESAPTLEQMLSAPYLAELVAAPGGRSVAWIANQQGRCNLWISDGGEARCLTPYLRDDGTWLESAVFTPDGRALVFARSKTDGKAKEIWLVAATGGDPVQLGEGDSPAVSPAGDRVVWLKGGQMWWAPLDHSRQAELLVEVRGNCTGPRWSPDGSCLCFVTDREDHSFVALYDLATHSLTYLAPGVDRDIAPAWSPDGRRVAFVRLPGKRLDETPYNWLRPAFPWSIWVADVATGEGRAIWQADPGLGSRLKGLLGLEQLFWGGGDALVFSWERHGRQHLYALLASGGTPRLLTPGAFDIEEAAMAADRKALVYSSNQDDPDRRHLWTVPVAGGVPHRLTGGSACQWSPTPLADGSLAYIQAEAARAPQVLLLEAGGERSSILSAALVPQDFPAAAFAEPELVNFPAPDGLELHGQLFLPHGLRKGERCPAVLFLHGGPARQMLPAFHPMEFYHETHILNQYLASRGYVVLSLNYRRGSMYGAAFRDVPSGGFLGASEFQDLLAAAQYLRKRPEVDRERIGLWGASYGGYLTALGLARASNLFRAGVDWCGIHDWVLAFDRRAGRLEGTPKQRRLAFESSPVAGLETWRSPVLLIHGDADSDVPFSQTVDLAQRLRERGIHVETLVLPDEGHAPAIHANWVRACRATADFFDRHLRAE